MSWEALRDWFGREIGEPRGFQERAWDHQREGRDGLLHVPTGAGKTYAAYLPALEEAAGGRERGLRVLYVAPLRAMARDLADALQAPVDDLGLDVTVETRTGDTPRSVRRRQRSSLPNVLLTTPESLNLLLTYANARQLFEDVRTAIVDEWHELLPSKRGTQTELGLARLRRWSDDLRTWALTATLGNVDEAARAAAGPEADPVVVESDIDRPVHVETLVPEEIDSFPWSGHGGTHLAPKVLEVVDAGDTTIVFTNTRSHAETWYRELLERDRSLAGRIGLHHGSLDQSQREFVEDGLAGGDLSVVVSTSSLDLGVDFAPVDTVVQIGSVKGVSRLVQRAGRAGHRPGASCRVVCVPTNALQLVEFAAVRDAVDRRDLEARHPPDAPVDVLVQHLVTCGLGGGFEADRLVDEVRDTVAYEHLDRATFETALEIASTGSQWLESNEFYHRLEQTESGRWVVDDRRKANQHRVTIGTITSSPALEVKYENHHRLGTVEERFVSQLDPGDRFVFGGKVVELVQVEQLTAFVRRTDGEPNSVPRWLGGRLPLSRSLSDGIRRAFDTAARGRATSPELGAAAPILAAQRDLSALPRDGQTLFETTETDDGHHLYVFPFAGRLVHEGLAALLAYRLSRGRETTFGLSANEWGCELVAPEPFDFRDHVDETTFSSESLREDAREAVNLGELSRRQFRRVARVSGLVFEGYPGSRKSDKQLQESANVLYRVFRKWDPEHPLLRQAEREVLERQFERTRLEATLDRIREGDRIWRQPPRPSPLGFPLLVERVGARLSTETLRDRIERMKERWKEPS